MAAWIKESGAEIELNEEEATVDKAKSMGWKLKVRTAPAPEKKVKKSKPVEE